jgi:LacI family transcriptional regulator
MLEDIRHFLERQRPYGVMILPPISENDSLAALCSGLGVRYVRMGSAPLDAPANIVVSNDREVVGEAVAHLIAAGHRRIGMVAGPHGFRSAAERQRGYEEAIERAGLPLQRTLIVQGDYRFESGMRAAERLLDLSPRPTAVFSSNDEMAAGVLHVAHQRGLRVPQDLSIIGFDDTPIASHIWPPLTTVRWPIATMARAAALKLIGASAGGEDGETSLFVSTLIRRASVAPPGAPG